MYGIINQALKLHICEKYGAASWKKIQEQSGIDLSNFTSMQRYPDSMTYQLIQTGVEVLNITAEQLIEEIGYFWVFYMGTGGYKEIFTESGDDFLSFLQNLNYLHGRVKSILPALQPPKFECTDISATQLRLHYYSCRDGFSPMVLGLVKGLADWFKEPVRIKHILLKERGDDHDVFEIKFINVESNRET